MLILKIPSWQQKQQLFKWAWKASNEENKIVSHPQLFQTGLEGAREHYGRVKNMFRWITWSSKEADQERCRAQSYPGSFLALLKDNKGTTRLEGALPSSNCPEGFKGTSFMELRFKSLSCKESCWISCLRKHPQLPFLGKEKRTQQQKPQLGQSNLAWLLAFHGRMKRPSLKSIAGHGCCGPAYPWCPVANHGLFSFLTKLSPPFPVANPTFIRCYSEKNVLAPVLDFLGNLLLYYCNR